MASPPLSLSHPHPHRALPSRPVLPARINLMSCLVLSPSALLASPRCSPHCPGLQSYLVAGLARTTPAPACSAPDPEYPAEVSRRLISSLPPSPRSSNTASHPPYSGPRHQRRARGELVPSGLSGSCLFPGSQPRQDLAEDVSPACLVLSASRALTRALARAPDIRQATLAVRLPRCSVASRRPWLHICAMQGLPRVRRVRIDPADPASALTEQHGQPYTAAQIQSSPPVPLRRCSRLIYATGLLIYATGS